jgi:hypothetical protein
MRDGFQRRANNPCDCSSRNGMGRPMVLNPKGILMWNGKTQQSNQAKCTLESTLRSGAQSESILRSRMEKILFDSIGHFDTLRPHAGAAAALQIADTT